MTRKAFGAVFALLLLAAALPATATPYNTIVVDGLWGAGEWDQANEMVASNTFAGWGDFGNVRSILVTWDASNLYVALRGNAWNNAMLLYIDSSSLATGQENADYFQGYDTQSFFDPDFVGGCYNMEHGSGGVPTDIRSISAVDGSTTSLLGTAAIAVHDQNGDGGLGEGLVEISIPWSVIGLETGGSVSVAAGAGWAVNQNPVIPAGGLGGFSGDELGGTDQQGGTDALDGTLDGAVSVVYDTDMDGLPDQLTDSIAPSLLMVRAQEGDRSLLAATFDEPVTQASAENLANWAIDGGLAITGATLQADPAVVHLQLDADAGFGESITVTASGIEDLNSNISGDTDAGFCLAELTLIAHMNFKIESAGALADVGVEGSLAPLTWDPTCDDLLHDDGLNGDAAAGDSTYTTQIVFCFEDGAAPALEYKLTFGCSEWESNNRGLALDCATGQTTVEIYWNDENPEDFTQAPVDVIFIVDVSDSLGARALVGINGGQGSGSDVPPLNWTVPSDNALSDDGYPGGVLDDGIYGVMLRFPEQSYRNVEFKYLYNDDYECADQGNRGVYLNEAAFDTLGGALGPLELPLARYQRCTVTSKAVEVIFELDVSYLYDGPEAGDTLAVNGSVAPLGWEMPSLNPMADDGVAPDNAAGDLVFTRSVIFPDSSAFVVDYKYLWNSAYECTTQNNRYFWIDDQSYDATGNPFVLGVDIFNVCHVVEAGDTPVAAGLTLRGNYPNPFNPKTNIAFSLAEPGRVRLEIFDLTGRLLRTLIDAQAAAGDHVAEWNGRDMNGAQVSSGIYFVRVSAAGRTESMKLTLLK
jgi:hypothetical protein